MKSLIIFALLSVGSFANADVIQCNFGDDGAAVYSTSTETLTISPDQGAPTKLTQVSLQLKASGQIDLLANDKKSVVMSLNLSKQGTDGNTDVVYPMEGHLLGKNEMWGGCSSNFLRSSGKQ